ncbi:MAG: M23 family metallopeptidase [Patescibacteria group bacterium]
MCTNKTATILTIVATTILGGCCAPLDIECRTNALGGSWPDDATSEDTAMGGGVDLLTIDLPFAEGYLSLCTQGANGSYSHHSTSTRYDVDLDTPNNATDPVYAPIGGIAYAHDESRTKNYGEHVTIDIGDGTYVILAHLDDIVIEDGDEVAAGQLIGSEGHTGSADGDHVHIGRHSGDATMMGEYGTSVNALAFTAFDTATGRTVTEMTTEMTCDISTGHTYQSTLPTPKWHPSGSLLKSPASSTVYLLDGFTVRPFLNESAFTSRNYDWDDIALVANDELACFSTGDSVSGTSLVTAVYDSTGAWLIVGAATDSDRYRRQILSDGVSTVLATWGIGASSVTSLPSPSSVGVSLSNYPTSLETATFRDGSLVSTTEKSDVYVMEGGAALPIKDWETYLLMGFGNRTVYELAQRDFDALVDIMGDCSTDSYCIANNDVTTCGGDTEDVPGTYPGEGTGGVDDEPTTPGTGVGLEMWWVLDEDADWITISGQFTNENGYAYTWNSNIAWSTWSNELYFAISDAGPNDRFRYSYAFAIDGVENWSCLGPYPPGDLTGTPTATYNGASVSVSIVEDPGSDGCGLEVRVP